MRRPWNLTSGAMLSGDVAGVFCVDGGFPHGDAKYVQGKNKICVYMCIYIYMYIYYIYIYIHTIFTYTYTGLYTVYIYIYMHI